jgi:hypothetical protein
MNEEPNQNKHSFLQNATNYNNIITNEGKNRSKFLLLSNYGVYDENDK